MPKKGRITKQPWRTRSTASSARNLRHTRTRSEKLRIPKISLECSITSRAQANAWISNLRKRGKNNRMNWKKPLKIAEANVKLK